MPSLYVDPDDLAVTLKLSSDVAETYADELERACFSASAAVEKYCDRIFQLQDSEDPEERRFTALGPSLCVIDDLAVFDELTIDRWGTGTFGDPLVEETDFTLLRAAVSQPDEKPFDRIKIRGRSPNVFPTTELGVKVSGRWGWLDTPIDVVEAVGLLASQLYKRRTESPYGIVTISTEAAMRVLRYDPHLCGLLEPFCSTAAEVG